MYKPIKELTYEQVREIVSNAGLPAFRAEQLLAWLYVKGVQSYEEMTNIPKTMREQFDQLYPLYNASVIDRRVSVDGSRKYLIQFNDGEVVETVGLPSSDGRLTVCCSSQAGCPMACSFCATGMSGFKRNLHIGEIIDQIIAVQKDFETKVTNVVVMGQGEPFANYDSVLGALRIINNSKLLNIGARHITVSTCGLIQGIKRFSSEPEQFTLAVSLHSAQQIIRDRLIPSMAEQRLGELRKTLDNYTAITGRRFSLEYALINGVNDDQESLDALITFCRRLLCHVNLIPLNDIDDSPFKPSPTSTINHWFEELESAGVNVSIRRSRGSDIDGACGQLRNSR